jgi:hypothetical protein
LPVATVIFDWDLSLSAVYREIGLVGWIYSTTKLPPLPFWKILHFQLLLLALNSHIFVGI